MSCVFSRFAKKNRGSAIARQCSPRGPRLCSVSRWSAQPTGSRRASWRPGGAGPKTSRAQMTSWKGASKRAPPICMRLTNPSSGAIASWNNLPRLLRMICRNHCGRSRLSAIASMSSIPAELGEQGRDYLSRMLASATRMRTLIDALLTFSRVTTKAQPFVAVDLRATAEEVISDLEERIQRSAGQVEVGLLPTRGGRSSSDAAVTPESDRQRSEVCAARTIRRW